MVFPNPDRDGLRPPEGTLPSGLVQAEGSFPRETLARESDRITKKMFKRTDCPSAELGGREDHGRRNLQQLERQALDPEDHSQRKRALPKHRFTLRDGLH